MEELKVQVQKLSDEELKRAMVKHPLFFSKHQGYAIIKEEVEETELEMEAINISLSHFWNDIKENNGLRMLGNIEDLKEYAINLAAESIQVAAMCQKFIDSFKDTTHA